MPGSTTPFPAIDELGVVEALQAQFVQQMRQPKAGFALVAGKTQRGNLDWGNENFSWEEVGDTRSSTVVTMDFPAFRSATSGDVTKRQIELPFFTQDREMGGRKLRQLELWVRQHGLDGIDQMLTRDEADQMAEDLNKTILKGTPSDLPGEDVGILNHSGVITVSGGTWTDGDVMNSDLSDAFAQIVDRGHRGGFALLHNPIDSNVMNEFLGDGSTGERMGDNLPAFISRQLMDAEIAAQTAYLVPEAPGKYDWVLPPDDPDNGLTFGLPGATAGVAEGEIDAITDVGSTRTRQERRNAMMQNVKLRFLNCGMIRIIRTGTGTGGSPVAKISFSK